MGEDSLENGGIDTSMQRGGEENRIKVRRMCSLRTVSSS